MIYMSITKIFRTFYEANTITIARPYVCDWLNVWKHRHEKLKDLLEQKTVYTHIWSPFYKKMNMADNSLIF